MLGGASAFIYVLGLGIEVIFPGSMSKPGGVGPLEFFVGLVVILVILSIGLYGGLFVWLICMKPFFKREELIRFVSQPYIPVATNICLWLFNIIFPVQ